MDFHIDPSHQRVGVVLRRVVGGRGGKREGQGVLTIISQWLRETVYRLIIAQPGPLSDALPVSLREPLVGSNGSIDLARDALL